MPVIVSTHFGRPHYVKQSISSLEKCKGIENYTYVACLDKPDPDIKSIIERSCLKTEVYENGRTLGVDLNTKEAIKFGFERDNFVILVEGDVVLSPDALTFYEWCRQKYESDSSVFTCTAYSNLFHEGLDKEVEGTPNGKKLVRRRPFFSGVTFGIWRDRWDEVKDKWIDGLHPTSRKPMPGLGWDIRMREFGRGRDEVFPLWSRANHVGLTGGLNCGFDSISNTLLDEKWYYDNTYVKAWAENGEETEFTE